MRPTRLPAFALAVLACSAAAAPGAGANPAGIDWQAVGGFQIARTETTVAQFARFARATQRHRTLDEDALAACEPDLAGRFAAALELIVAPAAPRTPAGSRCGW